MDRAAVDSKRGWIGSCLLLAAACFFSFGSEPAFSHWDGDPSADGHFYRFFVTSTDARTPQTAFDLYLQLQNKNNCGEPVFNAGTKRWQGVQGNASYGSTNCTSTSTVNGDERHCSVGENYVDGVGCQPTQHCHFDPVSWVSSESGDQYVNVPESNCLWEKTGGSVNGACFNVTYQGTGWLTSDEDDWTSAPNDGAAIDVFPAVCPGEDPPNWPFGGPIGDLDPSERCPAGEVFWLSGWPYGDPHVTPTTLCSSASCRADVDASEEFCLGAAGSPEAYCGSHATLTGESCNGGESFSLAQPTGEGSGEVVSELQRIYSRLGSMSDRNAAGQLATIAAIEASQGEGGDDHSELIGEHGDEDPAGDIDALGTALDGDFDAMEQDLQEGDFFEEPQNSMVDTIAQAFPSGTCVDLQFPIPGNPSGVSAEVSCSDLANMRALIGWIMKITFAFYLFNLMTTRPQGGAPA